MFAPLAPELRAALEDLLHELDRLMLIGHAGRQRRGLTTLSVESLRYGRMGVASVLAGEADALGLRGLHATFAGGTLDSAPLLGAAARVEALLPS